MTKLKNLLQNHSTNVTQTWHKAFLSEVFANKGPFQFSQRRFSDKYIRMPRVTLWVTHIKSLIVFIDWNWMWHTGLMCLYLNSPPVKFSQVRDVAHGPHVFIFKQSTSKIFSGEARVPHPSPEKQFQSINTFAQSYDFTKSSIQRKNHKHRLRENYNNLLFCLSV